MRTARQRMGDQAEQVVAACLAHAGWRVLARNLRVGRAEIDLLGIDPGPPPTLVAVEVRWRSSRSFGLPEETVDHRKRSRLHGAAFALQGAGVLPDGTAVPGLPLRFDLVVVEPGPSLRHHRHAL